MKKYVKHIVLATLFVVCAITTIWAINYDKSTTPLNNEITSGVTGSINVPIKTMKEGVIATSSTITNKQYGDTIEVVAPIEEGYVFLYWLDGARNKILSYQSTYNYRILSATPDLRAVYLDQTKARVVFLDANQNQIAVAEPTNIDGVLSIAAPASNLIPVRPGYEITGWSQTLSNLTVDANGVAYVQAIYERDNSQFNELINVYIDDVLYGSYEFDKKVTIIADLTKEDYNFSHWMIDDVIYSYNFTITLTITHELKLYKVYTEVSPTKKSIAFIYNNAFVYPFGSNTQITYVGKYELVDDAELVDVGIILYKSSSANLFDLNTEGVIKVASSKQSNNNEYVITNLSPLNNEKWYAKSYIVYDYDNGGGTARFTSYSDSTFVIDLEKDQTYDDILVDFNDGSKTAYQPATDILINGKSWNLFNVVLDADTGNHVISGKSIRMEHNRNSSGSAWIQSNFKILGGIQSISLYSGIYSAGAGTAKFVVEYSYDGENWDLIGEEITVTGNSLQLERFEYINIVSDVFIRVRTTSGGSTSRINIDNFQVNPIVDTVPPVFSGLTNKEVIIGQSFDSKAGVSALDNIDGDVTSRIQVSGTVDTNILGTYILEYTVSDYSGNITVQSISVEVVDISDSQKADIAATNLTKPNAGHLYTDNFTLSITSSYGSTVEWTSNNAAITISGANATVVRPEGDNVNVRLTWVLSLNSEERTGYVDVVVVSVASVTTIYSTGFESSEGFTAGTTYNNTNIIYQGPSGQQWGFYYGTPSTTGPISGSQSGQLRFYTANPDRLGYMFTNFNITGRITTITFKALNTSGNNVMVEYSIDGGSTWGNGQTFTLGTSSGTYTYNVNLTEATSSFRVKFTLVPGTTNGSRVTIDDVQINGYPN